jgi:hypothetical protein
VTAADLSMDDAAPADLPLPHARIATPVVPAPGAGMGNWAGAPSAVLDGGGFALAYRVRRPVTQGRGVAVVIARYRSGRVEPIAEVPREALGAESLERPALVRRPGGGWRLYLSCATWNSKHWWIECLDADDLAGLPQGHRTVVFAGSDQLAVKDPVIRCDRQGWHAWVCCHPLALPGQEDRMWSAYAHSADGLAWSTPMPVLSPRGTGWDARGTRITAVLPGESLVAYYDGRPDAAQNWYERTGIAVAAAPDSIGSALIAVGGSPVAGSPYGNHALRYLCVVPLPDGGHQLFYEASRPDGAHDLVTQTVAPAA